VLLFQQLMLLNFRLVLLRLIRVKCPERSESATWLDTPCRELISGVKNKKIYIYFSILKYTVIFMEATTIKVHGNTKQQLDQFREYKNESYDELIKKMIYIAKKVKTQPELSKEVIESIEKARKRIKSGNFVTEEEARKRLGF